LIGLPKPDRAVHALRYAVVITLLSACSSPYYNVMERLGFPKRDILVDRVETARDSQEQAAEQFKDALKKFIAVTGFKKGGALQEKYDQLESEYEQSEARATEVHQRIEGVEDVAEALFDEWEAELKQYTSAPLRRSSERQLQQTRAQYAQLIRAMKRAEAKMEPVLAAFHDQVLFLKHNLNARAIASLKGNLASIESDIAVLIREMEASIREANRFIDAMNVEQIS
jgi:putative cell wall-binding protein